MAFLATTIKEMAVVLTVVSLHFLLGDVDRLKAD